MESENRSFPDPTLIKTYSGLGPIPEELVPYLWEDAHPFYLKSGSDNRDAVVICLHGYRATPYEVRPIAEACVRKGIDAVGPLFIGHGFKDPEIQKYAFKYFTARRILEDTEKIISDFKTKYRKIFVFGQSMGGAVALIMAARTGPDGCAVTAPAIKLPLNARIAATLLGFSDMVINSPDKGDKPYINYSYKFVTPRSVKELNKIAKTAVKLLGKIKCPVLEFHSHNDDMIDPSVAGLIESKVKNSRIMWFDNGGHTMPLDVDGPVIAEKTSEFFASLLES